MFNSQGSTNESLQWYVMLNSHPQLLDFQLQRDNIRQRVNKDESLPLLEYFIPYCFLKRQSGNTNGNVTDTVENANNLRQDFHDFIFVHSTKCQIERLLNSEWNKSMRSRLRYYRDRSGREVIITDAEMNTLIAVFSELRLRFSFGLPVQDLGPDVKVQIRKEGSFQGRTARIIEVKHTADGISLKLGIPMFNGLKELKLSDLTLADIQTEGVTTDIIGTLFIQDRENALTDILERRVRHTETDETRYQDTTMLNNTFLYSYVTVNDSFLSARFHALMLICATLRFDRENVKILVQSVKEQIESDTSFPSETQAWLNSSLYISTRDADYRTSAKQCIRLNPDTASSTLRRLMSLICLMRSKRKRKK